MESILTSVKKQLGIVEEYEHYDVDLITHINSVFMTLNQIGVGPKEGFRIEDKLATWNDFISTENLNYEAVKSYLPLKVKLIFDPPDRSAVMEALKNNIYEMEFRLNLAAETDKSG